MQQAVRLKIYAQWQTEAGRWVASSSDINGLTAEAGTLAALEERLEKIVPDLMSINGLDGHAALIVDSVL